MKIGIIGAENSHAQYISRTINVDKKVKVLPSIISGNDSAPLHIAVVMGTPTVGIFGQSNSAAIMPSGNPRHIAVTSSVPCSPCYANSVFPGCESPKCLESICVDEVVQAASAQLLKCASNHEKKAEQ